MVSANVNFKPIEVPKILQEGDKFIKWDEESGGNAGVPVNLRVDPKGFFLYWTDQNLQIELLDIATIRDVRTGQYAKVPKDPKLRSLVTIGDGNLEEKTVSVCYGADFVNVSFVNFCCAKEETAQLWTEELFLLAHNPWQLNNPANMFLQKVHTKITLMADKTGTIPVKNIIRIFAANKEDRKRVEKALGEAGLPAGKSDSVPLDRFTYEDFFSLYKQLTQRPEVYSIFTKLTEGKPQLPAARLVEFLNDVQRDPRLNEILHPYADLQRARDIIAAHEPAGRGHHLTFDGFLRYLMSEDNPIIAPTRLELCDDMEQPLSHYFINSSHNTYLTGHQLTGKSSVEIYRQTLLAGCRCVELDFWNGRTEEPVIVHGYTFVPEISARDVLEAIAESAFKTSDYPVILSFENHCNPRQQSKIAHYCREIFGEMLLERPLDSHQLEPGGQLPPPSLLRRKIIIKNKKKHHHHKKTPDAAEADERRQDNGDVAHPQMTRQSSKESVVSSESDSSSGEEEACAVGPGGASGAEGAGGAAERETHAGAEISALVNYVQPVHFSCFENAEKKNRFYEMSSFDEKQAMTLLKERPIEFVNYNKHQLSRVYPAGTRFDSSNFMPQVFWNAGCQLVALNFQTLDLAMQLNLGTFEFNRRCGYLLKPEFMRRKDRRLDPFAESTVDGIIAGSLSVTVLSAQLLTDKRCGTYIEVDMFGLPADTVRKRFRTRVVPNNAINPVYGEEPFVFKKVVLPQLASIRLAAYEDSGRLIGHRVLPVVGLCPGYRHVGLRTELGQPLVANVFLLIVVKDYVPDGLSELAEALANPIKYQSELDKRSQQLAVLTEDTEPDLELCLTKDKTTPAKQSSLTADASWSPARHRTASLAAQPESLAVSVSVTPPASHAEDKEGDTQAESETRSDLPTAAGGSSDELVAESVDSILACKSAREKRAELARKLDNLRRKHGKERRGSVVPKFYRPTKLVKRLSSRNMTEPPTPEADGEAGPSTDECSRAQAAAERELRERYHRAIYQAAEKHMRNSQQAQMKVLASLLERETGEVMRRLQTARREEVRQLAKLHRDKDELVRIKRELDSQVVERGVSERVRLAAAYEQRRAALALHHERVWRQLQARREQDQLELERAVKEPGGVTPDG